MELKASRKAPKTAGACQALLVLFTSLTLTACFNDNALLGGGQGATQSSSFQGCVNSTPINTSSILVSFEWPNDAESVSVMRNGQTVYTSFDGTAGEFLDMGLLEGNTYRYSCAAGFRKSNGTIDTRIGTRSLTATTIAINAPTFSGISQVVAEGTSSARVFWTPAQGVPTAKYIAVAKLEEAPVSQDFDNTHPTTQSLISQGRLVRVESTSAGSIQATLNNLGDEFTYHFAVKACSASNVCTMGDGSSDVQTLSIADRGAPTTVGVTSAAIVDSKVRLTAPWQPQQGRIAIRRVYRSTVGGSNIDNYINVQNFEVSPSTNVPTQLVLTGDTDENTTYYFIVRDEDPSGNLTSSTQVASVATGDLTPPPAFAGIRPANELESTIQGQAVIRWAPPADWSDYRGFKIYTKNPDHSLNFLQDCMCPSNTNCSAGSNITECVVSGLNPYQSYDFHVRAFDASNNITSYLNPEFSYSSLRIADTTAPTFSSALQVGFSGGVTLTWSAASDNQYTGDGAQITYQVWRKSNATFASSTNPNADADGGVPLATQTTRTFLDTDVSGGNTYYYTICALDASGNRRCDGLVGNRAVADIIPPTISISDNKTSTGKTWNLTFTIADNATPEELLQVVVRRKVATTNDDFPTVGASPIVSQAGLTTLNNQGNPVITGTEGVARYVNYLVTVQDQAGNVASATRSIFLDNAPPSSDPVLGSFTPASPSNSSTTPNVTGTVSANTATVRLYSNSSCSTQIASGTKAQFEGAGFDLSFAPNTSNSVYARAETSAATLGNCVLLGSYVHDNVAPSLASATIEGPEFRGVANLTWDLSFGAITGSWSDYCIRQNNTGVGGCSWVSAATLPSTFSASSIEGANQLHVWLRDSAGNVSTRVESNIIQVDATPPFWPDSVDGPTWTTSGSSIGPINYLRNATDLSGIDRYEYAVGTGTSGAGAANVRTWTVVENESFSVTGLSLSHNQVYYVNVRALDVAGNATINSHQLTADLDDPSAPQIASPFENQSITVTAGGVYSFTGSCDSGAGNNNTLHVTPASGVTIQNVSCDNDVLSIQAGITGLNFSSAEQRTIELYTEKPSGRVSPTTTRNVFATGVCPPNYIGVAGNASFGTSDFCVAKFEMKAVTSNPVGQAPMSAPLANSGNGNVAYNASWFPDSRPDGTPWVNINQRNAVLQCDRLNATTGGTGAYQLITNAEWQTLASAIEGIAANWSGATPAVGVGHLARGHTDNGVDGNAQNNGLRHSSTNALAAMTTSDLWSSGTVFDWTFANQAAEFAAGYRGTGNNSGQAAGSGWEQRRTHYLPSGEVIWDVAGNVWQWVRFTESGGTLDAGIADNTAGTFNSRVLPQQPNVSSNWYEFNNDTLFSNTGGTGSLLSNWFRSLLTYSGNPSAQSAGRIYISQNNTGNAVLRGGSWLSGDLAGAFASFLFAAPSYTSNSIGFRCAFRP